MCALAPGVRGGTVVHPGRRPSAGWPARPPRRERLRGRGWGGMARPPGRAAHDPAGRPLLRPSRLRCAAREFLEGRASNFPLPGLGTCCWWAAAAAAERSICVSGCRVPTAPTRPLTHAAAAQPSVGGGGGWGTGAGAGGPPSRRAGARGSWPPAGWAGLPGGIIGGDPSGTGKIAASSNPPHLAFQN